MEGYLSVFLDLSDKISYLCAIAFDIEEGKDMRTSAAMENLWLYLQSLPKSNKKWLSEKLIEDLKAESEETISKEEILAGIDRGLKEMKESNEGNQTISALLSSLSIQDNGSTKPKQPVAEEADYLYRQAA